MSAAKELITSARSLIRRERVGILCTVSQKVSGWPYGSLTPYALSSSGEPIILISDIAEHTRNLLADPRMSLFIRDSTAASDPQSAARITLMGTAQRVRPEETDEVSRIYLERFPSAQGYFAAHGFAFFQLATDHIHFIGGFGLIGWLPPRPGVVLGGPRRNGT